MNEYFIKRYNFKNIKIKGNIVKKETYGGIVLNIIDSDFDIIRTMLNDIGIKNSIIDNIKQLIDLELSESNTETEKLILITDDFKLLLCGRYIADV